MLALLPLVLQLVPTIASWLGADSKGQAVAGAAAQVVAAATGTSDLAAAQAALAADPKLEAQVRVQLAQLVAQSHAADQQAQTSELAATLADLADARRQTEALAATHSVIAWGAPVVSVLIMAGFGYAEWASFNASAAPNAAELGIIELTKLMCIGVTTYWLGSSVGSKTKDAAVQQMAAVAATQVPASTLDRATAVIARTTADLNDASLRRARGQA